MKRNLSIDFFRYSTNILHDFIIYDKAVYGIKVASNVI